MPSTGIMHVSLIACAYAPNPWPCAIIIIINLQFYACKPTECQSHMALHASSAGQDLHACACCLLPHVRQDWQHKQHADK